jgi:hypothetical protein
MEALARSSRQQLDRGIGRVPLPSTVAGALFLCGQHAIGRDHVAARGEVGRLVGRDPVVVCLVEADELRGRYDEYADWLDAGGDGSAMCWPIPDMHAPAVGGMLDFVDDLVGRLRRGEALLVHCAGDIGRTGTTAICLLIRLGVDRGEAERTVAKARPGAAPEVDSQRALVDAFAGFGAQSERS